MATANRFSIYQIIGKGYESLWWTNCHCRYRCLKGARNTKKSYDFLGVEVLDKILSDPLRNVLILRQVGEANRNSTFNTICMLIHQPDPINNPEISLDKYFQINNSSMTITYRPTGQVIMFGGMLTPMRLTSIRSRVGYLTDIYVEEAFELKSYDDWRKIDGSLRGKLPQGEFLQITFCFNAWNKSHWLYEHFFKGRMEDDFDWLMGHPYQQWINKEMFIDYGKGLALHTSTYKINEFRDMDIYDKAMDELQRVSLDIYKVEALGMWGVASEVVYPEYNEGLYVEPQVVFNERYASFAVGIDFGISDGQGNKIRGKDANEKLESATTMQLVGLRSDYNGLDCVDEWFFSNQNVAVKKTAPQMMEEMVSTLKAWREKYQNHPDLMKGVLLVYVDCADSGGFRQGLELEARRQGLINVRFLGSTKLMIESRVYFTRQLMAYGNFRVCKYCENLNRELKSCVQGENGRVREDINDHAINACEYAWAPLSSRLRMWANFKVKH